MSPHPEDVVTSILSVHAASKTTAQLAMKFGRTLTPGAPPTLDMAAVYRSCAEFRYSFCLVQSLARSATTRLYAAAQAAFAAVTSLSQYSSAQISDLPRTAFLP